MHWNLGRATHAVVLVSLVIGAPPAGAQDNLDSKLTIHGFLSQAYAQADEGLLVGIPEDGTSDYRSLALQLRYAMTENDTFVLQLSHERLGKALVAQVKEEIEVDWAFYQHRFVDGTYIKVGRVPIPLGIYNEFRDVGTLLPFYTPPFSIYFDGQLTNEAVDGAVVGKTFFDGRSWSLGADVFAGSFEVVESVEGMVEISDASDAVGMQLWLNTPVPGLRLGAAANRYDVSGGLLRVEESDEWKSWAFSIDGNFDKFLARAELYSRDVPLSFSGLVIPEVNSEAWYVQLGYRFDEHWAVYGQYDEGTIKLNLPSPLPTLERDFWKDTALSANYSFRPDVVLKLEYHQNEGYLAEAPETDLFGSPPAEIDYWITSLSVSF